MILLFFLYCPAVHQDLHSFPTRRSSDLVAERANQVARSHSDRQSARHTWRRSLAAVARSQHQVGRIAQREAQRSEEHTSELQSHHDLVCRLLLEKKKQ